MLFQKSKIYLHIKVIDKTVFYTYVLFQNFQIKWLNAKNSNINVQKKKRFSNIILKIKLLATYDIFISIKTSATHNGIVF